MSDVKTLVIYDSMGEENVQFAILDGDYSHLNNVYVGMTDSSEEDEDELIALQDAGIMKLSDKFPTDLLKDNVKVISVGHVP